MNIRIWKRNITNRAAVLLSAALLCMLVFFGESAREDRLFALVLRQAKSELYAAMLHTAAPSFFYEKRKDSVAEKLLEFAFAAVPVYGYAAEESRYATLVESEISYESILAREAADENYIDDATGQLAGSGETVMPEIPIPDDLAMQQDKTALTDGIFVPNQTPAVVYPMEKLNDFDYLLQNFYVVDRTTTITGKQLNAADLLGRSMKLSHGPDTPQILIYHTHSQERFADSKEKDASDSIVGAGEYLSRLLTEYGFHVLHHTGTYDLVSRDGAYAKAGPAIEQILKENPGIEVVIDLHRDGVAEDVRLVTEVQGKQTASILFFNGLSRTTKNGDISYLPNPYIQDNLAFSFQMQLAANMYYPGFSRAVYLKGYRYNMHYCPKTLLVEVGAQTNTVQEIKNAMEPLADLIAKVIAP